MFLGTLLADDRGAIVCSNILDGLDSDIYRAPFVKEVFDWWEALCDHKGITVAELSICELRALAFDSVLKSIPDEFRRGIPRPKFPFRAGRQISGREKNELVATVVPADRLRAMMTQKDIGTFENRLGVKIPDSPSEWTSEVIARLQSLTAADRAFTIPSTTPLHPLCLWYTRVRELQHCLRAVIERPNIARDVLGLVHYEERTPVAVLYFPHQELTLGPDARPTFIEAGDNRRFKARADAAASKKQKSWGHAADLKKIADGHIHIDGCRERIAQPIPHPFQLHFEILGLTSGVRGSTGGSDSDKVFAELLVGCKVAGRRRTRDDVGSRLRALL